MNRYSSRRNNNNNDNKRELLGGGKNLPVAMHLQHRRGHSFSGISKDTSDEDQLDLFSKTLRSLSVASSSDASDVSVKLGRMSVGSAKLESGIDDLLLSTDGGKHDYDWLLTPPGTPLFPSSDGSESQQNPVALRNSSLVRSVSTTKTSGLSASQSESNHCSRPARSSSVTRSSISTSHYSTYSSNRSSILNTSSTSVSSCTRPASPIAHSLSSARPSTASTRLTPSRSSTPSRTRPSLTSSSMDKTRSSQNSRPLTPSSMPQIPANLSSTTARSSSRPSTPTRRNPVTSIAPAMGSIISSGRVMSNSRSQGQASRSSSPSPRVRPPQQPVVPPDFPVDTPPNLRTTLPDRPVSAGRSRPGTALTMKSYLETTGSVTLPRRHSSPIVTRGRLTESPGSSRIHTNGLTADILESRKNSHISEQSLQKPLKATITATESTGFGRTTPKKSLDMAIRHMDIRNGSGSVHPISGTTLFPQSIRSASSKIHSAQALESVHKNRTLRNGDILEKGNHISRTAENGNNAHGGLYSSKLSEVDIYESCHYDAILLKEDLKNTNWLHSIDDKSDQELIFDNGFEPLLEPFGLL